MSFPGIMDHLKFYKILTLKIMILCYPNRFMLVRKHNRFIDLPAKLSQPSMTFVHHGGKYMFKAVNITILGRTYVCFIYKENI